MHPVGRRRLLGPGSDVTTVVKESDDASPADPAAPSFQPVSARGPALLVLGIAVLIVVAGAVGSAIASGSSPTLAVHRVALTPATQALHSIVGAGEPPADILGVLAVPTDSPVTGHTSADQGVSQYDRTVHFRSGLTSDQLVDVYRTLLPKLGWKVTYVGSGATHLAGSTDVLAKKGSGDSFYWEVGVVVSPTTSAGSTPFSLEVLELPDDS
jgi:hypothetical protein